MRRKDSLLDVVTLCMQDITGCDAYHRRSMLLYDDFHLTGDMQGALKEEIPVEANFVLAWSHIPHTGRGTARKFSGADIPGQFACR